MRWQPISYTADQHRRLTVEPAVLRRQAERRHQSMPLVIEKIAGANLGDWISGMIVVAFFAVMVMA
ncbi:MULTISPECIES: hypothetical protein [unclassified Sphingomonas]|uniref:hypothetical protein n=1 Tax=unclassified Sphingomonas TaxID=196159 RepID=UPI0006F8822F|nr:MULTISPECIES: hypothetical protein [unclassified Sphingomonas]KQM62404.1 hypothetical protein ASE65_05305 [Sphingomonas sp. Leaf16]KQN13807.1 hypothetical protein ASE81_05375 [Sphingomonas sp. Leaf29]KQN22964.1 hypothetical protein ASE83_00035 [Sphingomonas sp. Leaf32]